MGTEHSRSSYRVKYDLPDDHWRLLFDYLIAQADRFRAVFGPERAIPGHDRVMRLGEGRAAFLALAGQDGIEAYSGTNVVMDGSVIVEGMLTPEARVLMLHWGRDDASMWMYSLLTERYPLLQIVDSDDLDVFLVEADVVQLRAMGLDVASWSKWEHAYSSWYEWHGFWEGRVRSTELGDTDRSPFAFYATQKDGILWPPAEEAGE